LELFGDTLSSGNAAFLLLALALALGFEFVNGFHDTANAVATVIYTHTLRPTVAVVWSGCWNLIGVLASSGAVAFGVVSLLPADLVINVGSAAGFSMVFALLLSAIIWNLGTWYFGLPASSSHTLIGSIMGVGLASSIMTKGVGLGEGINWAKAQEIGMSLLVSPLIGFSAAALLLLLSKALVKAPELYTSPEGKKPPVWIRSLLMLTCTGVSFAHGSNDGQKGMGLIMLILIGLAPAGYALNLSTGPETMQEIVAETRNVAVQMEMRSPGIGIANAQAATEELTNYLKASGVASERTFPAMALKCREIGDRLAGKPDFSDFNRDQRRLLRADLYLISEALGKLTKQKRLVGPEQDTAKSAQRKIDKVTKFIPVWVKVVVALALGLGTMIGWKRIVVTVGEKIGKEHLSYAQGATAELVAMTTIGAADFLGLPVSTTHVLSSGIAGTMVANHSGIQIKTIRNLLLAWVLTLPVCVLMGAGLFAFVLNVVLNFAGVK